MWYSEYEGKYREISIEEFVEIDKKYGRHLGDDVINGHHISTVWLGLDYNYGGDVPVIYETMVFFKDSGEDYQCRYSFFKDALRGHENIICILQKGKSPEDSVKEMEGMVWKDS